MTCSLFGTFHMSSDMDKQAVVQSILKIARAEEVACSDSSKEAKRLTLNDTSMSNHCFESSNLDSGGCELYADDTILGDKCVVEDDSSDDALKSDFKFSYGKISPMKGILDYNIDSKENIVGLPINVSNTRSSPVDEKIRSQMDVIDDGVPLSVFNESESDMKSGNIDDLLPKEKLQRNLPKPSAGRRKNGYLENGGSVHLYTPPEQYADTKQPFGASSSGVTSLDDSIQKHKPKIDSDSLGCIQTHSYNTPKIDSDSLGCIQTHSYNTPRL
ncbi:hypothetical protein E2542_SST14191 [Spatholobus suberectus]|nr:hypothetical protein E2542_SST14191 [Spatholobus suberectus]